MAKFLKQFIHWETIKCVGLQLLILGQHIAIWHIWISGFRRGALYPWAVELLSYVIRKAQLPLWWHQGLEYRSSMAGWNLASNSVLPTQHW